MQEPPSPEVIDAIIDAIGNISGTTIGAIKARLLSDRIPIPGTSFRAPIKTVFGNIKEMSRLDACKQEAAKEDGDPQAKMVTSLSLPCCHSLCTVILFMLSFSVCSRCLALLYSHADSQILSLLSFSLCSLLFALYSLLFTLLPW